jgi:hypothetical protein
MSKTREYKNEKKLIDFTALGIDTSLFSPAANYYKKYKRYPSFEDIDYWDEEVKRLKTGYSVTSPTTGITIKITPEHYCYLNYCRIKLTDDPDGAKGIVFYRKAKTKGTDFPAFWDGDYIFYWVKYIARWGASDYPEVIKDGGISLEDFENLRFPDEVRPKRDKFTVEGKEYTIIGSGKNLVIGKKRRGGYSYKMGNSGSWRYHFGNTKATTLLTAYDMTYLTDDALMTKTVECIDFIDANTPFTKPRIINQFDHKKSGYTENINGANVEKGKLSQVMAISFRANTGAARGKDADEIYVEEAGKAPNLIDFSDATIDTLGDGVYSTGQIIWFGTGGGDSNNWEGFRDIFYEPSTYNCLEFENVWDEGAAGTYCGFFIPDYWNNVGFITENGESLVELAKAYELDIQKDLLRQGKTKKLIARQMEHPFSPAQAFAVNNNNIFDVATIRDWRVYVERNRLHINKGNFGKFTRTAEGKLKFEIDPHSEPLWEYPIKRNSGIKKSAAIIWFEPVKVAGKVPDDLYIIDVDTYRYDESTGVSVGAVYVKIRPSNLAPFNLDDRIVAQYVGRPRNKDEFCKIVFDLAEYYNAKIGYENDDQTLLDWAKVQRLNLAKWFESEFQLAYDERLKTANSSVSRKYGMHIGSGKLNERKMTGDEYIKEWLETPRTKDEYGNIQLNLHTIYDIGLLKELEQYNPEKGNFDRVAAFRIQMYHGRELVYQRREAIKKEQRSKFFEHNFFK